MTLVVAVVASFLLGAIANAIGLKARGRLPEAVPDASHEVSDEQALAIVTMGFSSGSITALTNRGWPPLLARALTANTIDALRDDPLMREELIVMARDALAHPDLNPARAGQYHTVKIHTEEP